MKKKILYITLVSVMLLASLIPGLQAGADAGTGVRGDANGDGKVNVLDMTKVARITLQMDAVTPGADANLDTLVNVQDITEIARIILGTSEIVTKYGGVITLAMTTTEPDFDLLGWFATEPQHLAHQSIWTGDWTKGPAAGYGDGITDWGENTNIPELNVGLIAESWSWTVNAQEQTVDTVITIRDNIYFANTGTAAGNLVNGRKMTTDDVLWCLDQQYNNPEAQNYQNYPELRGIHPVKTGTNEITITHPLEVQFDSIGRLFSFMLIFPPELWDTFGSASCTDIMLSVGTGPYMVSSYIPQSSITLTQNPDFWMTNPVGPGQGDQLPYTDGVKYIIIPDLSTRMAAFRTGHIDVLPGLEWEDAEFLETQVPDIMKEQRGNAQIPSAFFRMDQPPFDNYKVRKALLYGIDLNAINDDVYNGLADLISYPYYYTPAYENLYLGLDDPEMPASVAEMYTYNPVKAGELLFESGYPDGFATELTITQDCVDYYAILKEYWGMIDVDVTFNVVPDLAAIINANSIRSFNGMIAQFISPCVTYPEQAQYTGNTWLNPSRVDDPYVNEMAMQARITAITDTYGAMAITKDLTKFLLEQVYCIPSPRYPLYTMWWPWIKDYSGEVSVGYLTYDSWLQYVWIDQTMKNQMGY